MATRRRDLPGLLVLLLSLVTLVGQSSSAYPQQSSTFGRVTEVRRNGTRSRISTRASSAVTQPPVPSRTKINESNHSSGKTPVCKHEEPVERLPRAKKFSSRYFALCVSAVDEPDIVEWVEYHKRLGVGRIYVLDQLSHPPMFGLLWDYIESGFVEYKYITNPGKIQRDLYELCAQWYGQWHRWMGFIDMDEFIVIPTGEHINDVLKRYEGYNGVALNWRVMGSSGHIQRPSAGVLPSYSSCNPNGDKGGGVKVIADPTKIKDFTNPHYATYIDNRTAVNTNKEPVQTSSNLPALLDVMFLNHYRSKSLQDFRMKLLRKRNTKSPNFMGDFDKWNNLTSANCSFLEMPGKPWSPPASVAAYAATVESVFPCQKFGDVETLKDLPKECSVSFRATHMMMLGNVKEEEKRSVWSVVSGYLGRLTADFLESASDDPSDSHPLIILMAALSCIGAIVLLALRTYRPSGYQSLEG